MHNSRPREVSPILKGPSDEMKPPHQKNTIEPTLNLQIPIAQH